MNLFLQYRVKILNHALTYKCRNVSISRVINCFGRVTRPHGQHQGMKYTVRIHNVKIHIWSVEMFDQITNRDEKRKSTCQGIFRISTTIFTFYFVLKKFSFKIYCPKIFWEFFMKLKFVVKTNMFCTIALKTNFYIRPYSRKLVLISNIFDFW